MMGLLTETEVREMVSRLEQQEVDCQTASGTVPVSLYSDLLAGGPAWLDTVGWEDRKKDDTEAFKDILRSDRKLYNNPALARTS